MDTAIGEGRPSRNAMALSPDGRFARVQCGSWRPQQLYLRPLSDLEATPIGGTEGGFSPFFSPDGRWLGFWVGGGPAAGGIY